jgi:group I intron endonuclease
MVSGIYKFTNVVTGYVYVGQAQNLIKRHRAHVNMLRTGTHDNVHLQRSYDKHGEDNLKYEVIEHCGLDMLDEVEQKYLDWVFSTGKTYNFATSATSPMLGKKRSPEAVKKTADANRGRVRDEQQRKYMSEGAKKSIDLRMSDPEQREGILNRCKAASAKSLELLEAQQKSVSCLDTGEVFKNAKQAVIHYEGEYNYNTAKNIYLCCKGKLNQVLGRLWFYTDSKPTEKQLQAVKFSGRDRLHFFRREGCKHNYRRIKCVELDKEFDCIKDAERFLVENGYPKATRAYINMCLLGNYTTAYRMHWAYI